MEFSILDSFYFIVLLGVGAIVFGFFQSLSKDVYGYLKNKKGKMGDDLK